MITKIVNNFTGALTRKTDGDMNSGLAKYETSYGYDPFTKPGNLTWVEQPTSILTTSSVIVAMKTRTEGTLNYAYGITSANVLYKFTLNTASAGNPDQDIPSVIGAIVPDQTYVRSAAMLFYGNTEKIFVGGDAGVRKVNFDGSSAASIIGSFSQAVPRPMALFLGKIYFGNGNNIGEIDSTETVTTMTKLSPGFPTGTFVRDLDVTPDGNYLQIIVSRINNGNSLNGNTVDVTSSAPVESYKFYWNGTDTSYTAYETYNGLSLTANVAYSDKNMTLGNDLQGAAIFNGYTKVVSMPKSFSPQFGAAFSSGNMMGAAAPEYEQSSGRFKGSFYLYGQYDNEIPLGLFRMFRQAAAVRNDIVSMPVCIPVSNLLYTPPFYLFPNNVAGTAKFYYSAVESTNGVDFTNILWKFKSTPVGSVLGSPVVSGVWESQNELFSKKVKPTNVRFYTEPLVAGNSFKIEFVNGASSVIGGKTFTAGTPPVAVGDDRVWWTPVLSPGYSWGTKITNLGLTNWTGVKLEVDFAEAGQ